MKHDKFIRNTIIGIFVGLYAIVSIISTIHVIDFFALTNPHWLAVSLAIAFEVGAAASLAAIIILDKTSRTLVWFLFVLLTAMQAMGNMYYAYDHATGYTSWMELFSLNEEEPIYQKRILAIISGAILPIVALGFIKSLVDYIRPGQKEETPKVVIETPGKAGLDVQEPKAELKVEEVKPKVEELDEDALFAETKSDTPVVQDVIETVNDSTMSNTINEVQDLSKAEDELVISTGHEDARAKAIQEVLDENEGKTKPEVRTHVTEEPGNGSTTKRTFGPPDINNATIS
jgi:hypothetical protein